MLRPTYVPTVCLALLVGLSASPQGHAQTKPGLMSAQVAARLAARSARPITQMIVRYKDGQTDVVAAAAHQRMQALSKQTGVTLTYQRAMSGGAHVLALPMGGLPRADALALAQRLRVDPAVAYAEPDDWMYPAAEPTDTYYVGTGSVPRGQWHLKNPATALLGLLPAGAGNFPGAWNTTNGTGVTVAVVDTGVVAHTDLGGNVVAGYDFVTNTFIANDGNGRDSDPTDPGDWVSSVDLSNTVCAGATVSDSSWHGTHVAGTVAALVNGIGVVGGAHGAKVLNVRALGKCGGYTSDIIDAMRWSAGLAVSGVTSNTANLAKVVNLSLGATGACSISFQSAITEIRNAGSVVVVATGNEAGAVGQPANCNGVIAVTANTYEGDNADYANIGAETTLSAPGGGSCTLSTFSTCTALASSDASRYIWSVWNAGTTVAAAETLGGMAGTSMAAPHVAAAAALLLAQRPALTPGDVTLLLRSSARPHPSASYCEYLTGVCGSGLLDATAAMAKLTATAPIVSASASPGFVAGGMGVNLVGSASSLSGSTISAYQWSQDSGTPVTLQTSTSLNASFTAPATASSTNGLLVFRLTATDSNGETGVASVKVRVNSPPVFAANPLAVSATAGTALAYSAAANDIDGDALTYSANGLPAGAALNVTTGELTWSSPVVGSYSFSVSAVDGFANGTTTATVNLTVSSPSGGGGGALGGLGLALLLVAGWAARRTHGQSPTGS